MPRVPDSLDGASFDVVVVGGGVIGSACAWRLRMQYPSLSVLLLEQFDFGHPRGSSHGHSRIIRRTYPEGEFYTDMMTDAYALWTELEAEANETLLVRTGGLDFFPPGQEIACQRLLEACARHNVDFEVLSSEETSRRYPLLRVPQGYSVVFSPDAGVLKANKAVHSLQRIASARGAVLRDSTKVVGITAMVDGGTSSVSVLTDRGENIKAGACVLAAGPWTSQLCPGLPLRPVQVSVAYWRCDGEQPARHYNASRFPVFIHWSPEEDVYGIPCFEFPGLLKCCYHSGPDMNPDSRTFAPGTGDIDAFVKPVLSRLFGGIQAERPVQTETCMYTFSPDEDFIVDSVPGFRGARVVVGAGFSGHGFKLAPTVGRLLADLAVGSSGGPMTKHLHHFALSRVGLQPSKL